MAELLTWLETVICDALDDALRLRLLQQPKILQFDGRTEGGRDQIFVEDPVAIPASKALSSGRETASSVLKRRPASFNRCVNALLFSTLSWATA